MQSLVADMLMTSIELQDKEVAMLGCKLGMVEG
jgi:hypothetical protein